LAQISEPERNRSISLSIGLGLSQWPGWIVDLSGRAIQMH
jgi:hypothetical protein